MQKPTFVVLLALAAVAPAGIGLAAEEDAFFEEGFGEGPGEESEDESSGEFEDGYSAEYRVGVTVAVTSYGDGLTSREIEGTYYFEMVEDLDQPYRLQPFLQRASHAGGGYTSDDVGDAAGRAFVRYVLPESFLGFAGGVGFGKTDAGDDIFSFSAGMDFYLNEESTLAAALSWDYGQLKTDTDTTEVLEFEAGGRYIRLDESGGGAIDVFVGFASSHVADTSSGLLLEGRYFFDEVVYAGLKIDGREETTSLLGGFWSGDGFQAEIDLSFGGDNDGGLGVAAGMRF